MNMIILKLTEQEAMTLSGLLDIAVKAGGLQVAQAAFSLDEKVRKAGEEYLAHKAAHETMNPSKGFQNIGRGGVSSANNPTVAAAQAKKQ